MWEKDLQVAGYYLQDGEIQERKEELGEEMEAFDRGVDGRDEENSHSGSGSDSDIGISEEVHISVDILFY